MGKVFGNGHGGYMFLTAGAKAALLKSLMSNRCRVHAVGFRSQPDLAVSGTERRMHGDSNIHFWYT